MFGVTRATAHEYADGPPPDYGNGHTRQYSTISAPVARSTGSGQWSTRSRCEQRKGSDQANPGRPRASPAARSTSSDRAGLPLPVVAAEIPRLSPPIRPPPQTLPRVRHHRLRTDLPPPTHQDHQLRRARRGRGRAGRPHAQHAVLAERRAAVGPRRRRGAPELGPVPSRSPFIPCAG
jgi:hypothetical protein